MPDSRANATSFKPGNHPANARLTEADVRAIRHRRLVLGEGVGVLAREYGVGRCTVSYAVDGTRWGHVPFPPYDDAGVAP